MPRPLSPGHLAPKYDRRQQNLVYSFPDVGPAITTVDTLTYRLFGDLKGTAAGWDIDGQVGVMYSSMTEKYFGSLIPSLRKRP